MGIPSYFRYIINRYKSSRLIVEPNPRAVAVERLYLDLNGVIHVCSQRLLRRGEDDLRQRLAGKTPLEMERWARDRGDELRGKLWADVFDAVVVSIRRLVSVAAPRSLLYIAMDGVAPRAKMEQQRQRRFKKQLDDVAQRQVYHRNGRPYLAGLVWDSNCITPGTAFMESLSQHLRAHAAELVPPPEEAGVAVILSDSSVPGEGEHKVIQHMRAHPIDGASVIHGLDADLMMLSLATPQRILLLREKVEFGNRIARDAKGDDVMLYLCMTEMRAQVVRHCKRCGAVPSSAPGCSALVRDYVFLCFMLGNDFLPHHVTLEINENGVEKLLRMYAAIQRERGDFLTVPSDDGESTGINEPFLRTLFGRVAAQQDQLTHRHFEQMRKTFPRRRRDGGRDADADADAKLRAQLDELQHVTPHMRETDLRVAPGEPGWGKRYYRLVGGLLYAEEIRELCASYVQGLFWTLQYYYHGCYSTRWHYAHHCAPLFSDLHAYLLDDSSVRRRGVNAIVARSSYAYSAIEQLAIVLPRRSHVCLPKPCREALCAPALSLYYPSSFDIYTFGKRFRWQCPCALPRPSDEQLVAVVRSALPACSAADQKRFERRQDIIVVAPPPPRSTVAGE